MAFKEIGKLEEGFAEVYEAKVRPQLERFEHQRKAANRRGKVEALLCLLAIPLVHFAVQAIWGPDPAMRLLPFFVLVACVGAYSCWTTAGERWKSELEKEVLPIVAGHVDGLSYDADGGAFRLGYLMEMQLLPKHDRAYLTSRLSGTYESTGYEMVQAKLTTTITDHENRRKTQVDFEGLLFQFDVPVEAPSRIALMRERGRAVNKLAEMFSGRGSRSWPKVSFDHPKFEAAFETYSPKPDEAKAFMPDAFLDALVRIGHHGRFTAGFWGKNFYMAMERSRPFLTVGNPREPLVDISHDIHGVFDDIALAHRIIDRLHGL